MKNDENVNSYMDQILLDRVVKCKLFKKHGPIILLYDIKITQKIEVREMAHTLSQNIWHCFIVLAICETAKKSF